MSPFTVFRMTVCACPFMHNAHETDAIQVLKSSEAHLRHEAEHINMTVAHGFW